MKYFKQQASFNMKILNDTIYYENFKWHNILWKIKTSNRIMKKFKRQNVLWKIWTWKCVMKNLNVKMYYEKFERQNVLWKT